MLHLIVAFLAGGVVAAALLAAMKSVFAHPLLIRTNFRGREVPTAVGLVVVLTTAVLTAAVWLDSVFDLGIVPIDAALGWDSMLTIALGFGLLGLVDDLLGDSSSQGFRGHLAALARGRLTTGGLKLVGGGVIAVLAVAPLRPYRHEVRWLVVDALVVALAANLANLFDRAPGRVTKVAGLCALLLIVIAPWQWEATADVAIPPVPTLLVVGAAFGLLLPELKERLMLGDTGANVVGGALGLGVVGAVGHTGRLVALAVLVALNLASERISFSQVIAATPGLSHLDRWGRARE